MKIKRRYNYKRKIAEYKLKIPLYICFDLFYNYLLPRNKWISFIPQGNQKTLLKMRLQKSLIFYTYWKL